MQPASREEAHFNLIGAFRLPRQSLTRFGAIETLTATIFSRSRTLQPKTGSIRVCFRLKPDRKGTFPSLLSCVIESDGSAAVA